MGTSTQPSDSPVKVLIAEDSPTQAQRLRHILEQQGYEVGVAANGRLVLEMAPQFRPALIISDVIMPEMDGYELSRRIKADADLRNIPVILVTTMSDPQDVIRGLECGADNFVLKPYDEHYLLGRVRYVLANREFQRPQDAGMGVELYFNDKRHYITAGRLQILNLLLSTYDAAIQRNAELSQAQEELRGINAALAEVNRRLEQESRQREEAQQSLRESEQRLRSIVDNMATFVGEITPDGVLVDVNRAALESGGLQRQDVIGKRFEEAGWLSYSPAVQARLGEDIERALRGETVRHDMITRMADGALVPIDFMLVPVHDGEGRVVKLIASGIDITERKYFEKTLQEKNAALEAANQELESFSYSVSHDLRAPLRHIDGYIQMLVEDTASTLSSEARRYLNVITDASRQMGQLIDDLLAFSRMNHAEMHETQVDLGALVQNGIRDLEMPTQGRNIVWKVPPLPTASGDPAMLKQVFANLLGNAVKYTRPRDAAEIEIGSAGEEEGRLVLFVRDNGVGFDMKYADKLFGVFQRLHRPDEFEGTGIGLANVRRIIGRHGGRVWAEGKTGEGATFYFTLRPSAPAHRP